MTAVSAGREHSVVLQGDGTVTAWGGNRSGQTDVPEGLTGVTAVSAGHEHNLALRGDGTVTAWGDNSFAQSDVPHGLTGVTAVAAGGLQSLALRSDGTVTAWGSDFVVPEGLSDVTAVAAGTSHNLALRDDGTVTEWGAFGEHQIEMPEGLDHVTAVSAGGYFSLALRDDGTVTAWGDNSLGQTDVPEGLDDVVAVSAGSRHSLALRSDGTVVAWGYDPYGQADVPDGLSGASAVSAGEAHNLAVGAAPVLDTAEVPVTATTGSGYSYTFTTRALGATFGVSAGQLPAGLTLTPSGVLSGTPTAAGVSTFTVTASNFFGSTEASHTITVAAASTPPLFAGGKPDRGRVVYAALGDSFAAGNGTGLADLDTGCYRSSLAYAPLLSKARYNTPLTSVACSGATTRTVVDTQVQVLSARTDFVTLSVGGNDLGFATLAGTCVGGTDAQCLGATAQAGAFVQTVLPGRLDAAYAAVGARVRKAEVVVVGYPRFFAEGYTPCPQSQGITASEAAALNDLTDALDAVAAERARAAGFTYVSTVDAFTGHDMCAAVPWVNGALVPSPADAYHPTAAGHRDGYAPLVAQQLTQRRSRP